MPIYEYVCDTCGEDFEVMQKFNDPPLKKHDCAPKSTVKRKLSLTAFQLKGGGWYNEGYSSSGGGATESSKPPAGAACGGGGGG